MIKVAITGHRKLMGYDENHPMQIYVYNKIKEILLKIQNIDKDIEGISGMAIGSDQIFCKVCLELNIPYVAVCPFNGQENKWPQSSQDQYRELLSKAKQVIIVSKGNYSPRKMHLRNKKIAELCNCAIAVWNTEPYGGTYNCINAIKNLNKKIIHINPDEYNKNS